jgi:hypothetical protein
MSDKYPSMSPYNYCANNPVILVDPDGREIERKDPPKFWDALLGKLKIHPKQKQQTTQSETQQSPQVANQIPEVTVTADAMTWENILGIGVLEVGSVLSKLKTALVVEYSTWTACVAGVFTGVVLLFQGDTSPSQRDEMSQHGKNDKHLGSEELAKLQAKKEAGTLSSQYKLKLKAHEKATNTRHSRQSKDKKK